MDSFQTTDCMANSYSLSSTCTDYLTGVLYSSQAGIYRRGWKSVSYSDYSTGKSSSFHLPCEPSRNGHLLAGGKRVWSLHVLCSKKPDKLSSLNYSVGLCVNHEFNFWGSWHIKKRKINHKKYKNIHYKNSIWIFWDILYFCSLLATSWIRRLCTGKF